MRHLITSALISSSFILCGPAFAKSSKKFENTFATPVDTVRIEVVLSEDMAWRANNLPKKLKDRGSARNSRNGFAGNGYYGEKDLQKLVTRLEEKMEKRLTKEGVIIDENSANVLRITLEDARPNRPTFKQLGRSGLSSQSYALGGASFTGEIIANNGETGGEISYAWYENNICDAPFGTTWSDSNRAIDRFARKTAKSLAWD